MTKAREVKEWDRARCIQSFGATFILHNWTAASLDEWRHSGCRGQGCLLNSKVGICPALGRCVSNQGCEIAGGSAEWKGLKCNAFEMKWKGAEEWNMTCWLLRPGVLQVTGHDSMLSSVCVCVCVTERESEHCASTGWVCNVMQAAFAPVTSSSTLLFRPDGD